MSSASAYATSGTLGVLSAVPGRDLCRVNQPTARMARLLMAASAGQAQNGKFCAPGGPIGGGRVLRARWARTAIALQSAYFGAPRPMRSAAAVLPRALPTRKRPGCETDVSYSTVAEPPTVMAP
eukprot:3842888-Prymnesium_polylepis.2